LTTKINKLLVLGLDGYDCDYAAGLMAQEELPNLSRVMNAMS